MSTRDWSAWTNLTEREHLTEFGVNGSAVDYGHDFDTTTKASIVLHYRIRGSHLQFTRFSFLLNTFDDIADGAQPHNRILGVRREGPSLSAY